jgi:hypothetical protein
MSQTTKKLLNDSLVGVQLKLSSLDTVLVMSDSLYNDSPIKSDTVVKICKFIPSSQKTIILCFVNGLVVKQTDIIYDSNFVIIGKNEFVEIKSNENKL